MDLAALQALLVEHGYTVKERTWAMGHTLMVTHEYLRTQPGLASMRTYSDLLYVREDPPGWTYTNKFGGDSHATLDELLALLYRRLRKPMWSSEDALRFIAELEPRVQAAGYHIGLTGSVLTKGESRHDLDLILYPATTDKQDTGALEEALTKLGLRKRFDRDFIRKVWRQKGSLDDKHVESWFDAQDRRIDVFRLT